MLYNCVLFFFKQKTAYEMRISDWSSDVCSSDLPDYLDHIQQAATDARSFVEGMAKDDFLADKRTQQAVIMSLIVIGEAATKVMDGYVEFTQAHADVPWRSMRNMRNRMAHGYFDINLDVVWERSEEHTSELQSLMRSSYA